MRRMREDGLTPIIGFVIATVIFVVSFYYVVDTAVKRQGDTSGADFAFYSNQAETMAGVIFDRGSGWYDGAACTATGAPNTAAFKPEGVGAVDAQGEPTGRFGLGDEVCGASLTQPRTFNNLSFSKFANVYRAQYEKTANDRVDYREARTSLGLDQRNVDFHLRSWPVLASVRQILASGYKDPHMRPLYIGDYTSISGGGTPPYTKGVIDAADRVVVYINVTNNGATSTVFDAFFEIYLKGGTPAFTLHSKVLGAGESGNLSFTLLKTADWDWKFNNQKWVDVEIHDKDTKLIDTTISMSAITMTYASARQNQFAESEKLTFILGGAQQQSQSVNAKYYYSSYNGKGELKAFSDWSYRLVDPAGNTVATTALPNNVAQGHVERTFTSAATYTVRLENDAGTTVWNTDNVNIVDTEPGPFGGSATFSPGLSVLPEVRYIDLLFENFDANAYSATYSHPTVPYAAGGDVYPDIKDSLNNDLPLALTDASGNPTLSKYTTIMVGSNVDHNAMTSQAAKGAIRDWVFAGGTLIVFGSDDQSVNWLQPIFHASIDSASGGLATPDTEHPSLRVPNDLDYTNFKFSTEWNYVAGADTKFTHVVTSGPTGDVLGVGNPGSFGSGRVILSSWRPYDLTNDQATTCPEPLSADDPCQAIFLIHNLVTLSYRELYLDFGPPLPMGSPIGAQLRIGSVYHPEFGQLVEVVIQVFAFPGGS